MENQESQLYQYDLWYMSLYVGDRVVCRFRWSTTDYPDDEHLVDRNMYRTAINKYKKKNCASSWLFTKIVIRCTVNKT